MHMEIVCSAVYGLHFSDLVVYRLKTWSLIVREHRLKAFENRPLRTLFGHREVNKHHTGKNYMYTY
jgi:hypothetical protein